MYWGSRRSGGAKVGNRFALRLFRGGREIKDRFIGCFVAGSYTYLRAGAQVQSGLEGFASKEV